MKNKIKWEREEQKMKSLNGFRNAVLSLMIFLGIMLADWTLSSANVMSRADVHQQEEGVIVENVQNVQDDQDAYMEQKMSTLERLRGMGRGVTAKLN